MSSSIGFPIGSSAPVEEPAPEDGTDVGAGAFVADGAEGVRKDNLGGVDVGSTVADVVAVELSGTVASSPDPQAMAASPIKRPARSKRQDLRSRNSMCSSHLKRFIGGYQTGPGLLRVPGPA